MAVTDITDLQKIDENVGSSSILCIRETGQRSKANKFVDSAMASLNDAS